MYTSGRSAEIRARNFSLPFKFAAALLFILFLCISPVCAGDQREVLYINSYHPGHDWSDQIAQGISDYFIEDEKAVLFTEYMDTKQYPDKEHQELLYSLYLDKYRDRHFDAVITSDDNALFFTLMHHEELFSDTPVVFCGVNEVPYDFQENYPYACGILEYQNMKETIEILKSLHPDPLNKVYILTDNTETGYSYRTVIDKITPGCPDIEFVHIYDTGMDELLAKASQMPPDSAFLYIHFNRDSDGNIFTNEEAVSLISEKSSVPIYAMTDYLLDSGIAGGIIMSPYMHGYQTAEMAAEVMQGTKPQEIKIKRDSYNSYPGFSYNALVRYGFDFSKLPKDSVIINQPDTSIKIPVVEYLAILAAGVGFFFLSVLLVISNRKLKITDELLKASEERLSMAIHATKDGLWDWNFETEEYHINDSGLEILGYKKDEIIFSPDFWKILIHPKDRKKTLESFNESLKKPGEFTREYRIKTKSGAYRWIRTRGSVFKVNDNRAGRILGTFSDIEETVMYKNALIEANKKLNILSSVTRHDILNQVTALFGYIEIMKEVFSDNQEVSEYIAKLTRPVEVIQQQINFTRDYEDMGHLEPKWQNVSEVAERAALSAANEDLKISIDTKNLEIFADNMLEKVFYNLFDNTKRHGGNAAEISVSFKTGADKSGIIIVEDNGQGVEPSKKEEIFKKGFGGNSGYGLFLIRNILEITGIKIKETGIFGQGARFEIIVPDNIWHIPAGIDDI